MLVVTEKHMQDANWVYYPFKTVMFYMEQCHLQYLHKCMSCRNQKKKERKAQ